MRNHQRKTQPRVEEAAIHLMEVMKQESDEDGMPKTAPKPFPVANQQFLEGSTVKLFMWLDHFEKNGDSLGYSALLQLWLSINTSGPMKDVFKRDLDCQGPGRPPSPLGEIALQMYDRNKFGWRRIAQQLVPDRYAADADNAIKYVKDLAETARNARKHGDESPSIYDALGLLF